MKWELVDNNEIRKQVSVMLCQLLERQTVLGTNLLSFNEQEAKLDTITNF